MHDDPKTPLQKEFAELREQLLEDIRAELVAFREQLLTDLTEEFVLTRSKNARQPKPDKEQKGTSWLDKKLF